MTEQQFRHLLDKYIEGTTTEKENQILSSYESFSNSMDKNGIFKSDLEKIDTQKEIYQNVKKGIKRKRMPWFGIAASIAILIGIGITAYHFGTNSFTEYNNDSDTFKVVALDDGSTVTLNKKSSIRFESDREGTRYLELEGEAFFEIARNEKKPFIVKTGVVQTKVLGTSFNISEINSEVNITVASGLVEVSDNKTKVKLKPNQRATYRLNQKSLTTTNIDHNLFTFWYKPSIKLKAISMGELAEFLSYKYGTKVNFIDEQARAKMMTLTLKNDDLIEKLIEQINYIHELQLTKTSNNVITIKVR